MKNIFYIAIGLIFISCKKPKEEIIDMSEIIPKSERKEVKAMDDGNSIDSVSMKLKDFQNHGILANKLHFTNKKLLPDRFGPRNSEKYSLYFEKDSLQYHLWTFADSSKVMNALFNWLDHFGVERIGVEKRFQKEAFCLFVGDTSMIFIDRNSLSQQKWLDYHQNKGFDDKWNYIIEQKQGGRARWYVYEENRKVRLKN